MRRGPASRAFALMELLVVAALSSIMIGAMYALYAAAVRSQADSLRDAVAANSGSFLGHTLRQKLAAATYIEAPAADGVPSAELLAWENVDPSDGQSPIVPGERRFAYFCADSSDRLLLYEGSWPRPPILCGQDPPAGARSMVLAGGEGMRVLPEFARRARTPRTLELRYRVLKPRQSPEQGLLSVTQVQIR